MPSCQHDLKPEHWQVISHNGLLLRVCRICGEREILPGQSIKATAEAKVLDDGSIVTKGKYLAEGK